MFQELHPILIKFAKSAFSELNTNATSYIDLDAPKCEIYRFIYQKYKTDYNKYKLLHTAIKMYAAEIVKFISLLIILYIHNCKGTYNVLIELQTQLALTDEIWE